MGRTKENMITDTVAKVVFQGVEGDASVALVLVGDPASESVIEECGWRKPSLPLPNLL